jgi:hypothetical protein
MLFLACAASAPGCSDSVSHVPTSRLTVLLTDAPGDVKAAVVTISQVYLQGDASADPEAGRVNLLQAPVTTDLLMLANNAATLVDGAGIAAGTYGQLRFVIDGAYIEVETDNGTEVYATPGYSEAPAQVAGLLQCPSCSQSGIKVNFQGGLQVDEGTETLLVDFDVSETFGHAAGASESWVMHPSIKAAEIESAASLNVSLSLGSGVSLPSLGGQILTLAGFEVELRSVNAQEGMPGEIVSFGDADANGVFEARFTNVLPGSYVLGLRGPAGLSFATNPTFPRTIEIESGVSIHDTFTITAASPAT